MTYDVRLTAAARVGVAIIEATTGCCCGSNNTSTVVVVRVAHRANVIALARVDLECQD